MKCGMERPPPVHLPDQDGVNPPCPGRRQDAGHGRPRILGAAVAVVDIFAFNLPSAGGGVLPELLQLLRAVLVGGGNPGINAYLHNSTDARGPKNVPKMII